MLMFALSAMHGMDLVMDLSNGIERCESLSKN